MKKRILILGGGISGERSISLKTAKAVRNCIKKKYNCRIVEPDEKLARNIDKFSPHVVFNALHGRFGEDGFIQTYLENKGLSFDSKVGLYLHNSNEYLVAQFATFKNESVPINVNYRYQEDELIYLLDNSDAEAIFYQACYADRIKAIKDKLPKIKAYIQVMDGSEDLLEGSDEYSKIIQKEDRQEEKERSEENFYMLYTGGTTGMPKGVMYKQGSFLSSMMKTAFAMGFPVPENIEDIEKIIKDKASSNELPVSLVGCPLMHGTGMWLGAFLPHLSGGSVVTMPTLGFDPDRLWREVESKKASSVVIVGDAFARPMLDSLNKASEDGNSYSIDSLQTIISSGVMWSSEVKDGLLKHKDMVLIDVGDNWNWGPKIS